MWFYYTCTWFSFAQLLENVVLMLYFILLYLFMHMQPYRPVNLITYLGFAYSTSIILSFVLQENVILYFSDRAVTLLLLSFY